MENLLPTITVLMAEAAVVLLLLLGGILFINSRRKRQHQAEIEALMEMANGRNIALPSPARSSATERAPAPEERSPETEAEAESSPEVEIVGITLEESPLAADATEIYVEEVSVMQEEKQPAPVALTPEPEPETHHHQAFTQPPSEEQRIMEERIGKMEEKLAEIRHALELMDGKLTQVRQDHQKLAAAVLRGLEKSGKETAGIRQEFEPVIAILDDLRKRMNAMMASAPAAAAAPTAPAVEARMVHRPARPAQRPAAAPITAVRPARPEAAATPRVQTPAPTPVSAPARQPAPAPAVNPESVASPAPVEMAEDDSDYVLDAATLDRLVRPAEYGAAVSGIAVEEINLEEIDLDDIDPGVVLEAQDASGPFEAADQIFFQSSTTTGMKQGWYFTTGGGSPQGPFADKLTAELVMEEVTGRSVRTSSGRR